MHLALEPLNPLIDLSVFVPLVEEMLNDFRGYITVMELAGFVGCPSNASEECKRFVLCKGGYVSPFPYVVGVVDIIRHYLPSAGQA